MSAWWMAGLRRLLPVFLAFWMLFGGSFFWTVWIQVVFGFSLAWLALAAIAGLAKGCRPRLWAAALLPAFAALLSLLANLDIFWQSGWLLTLGFGLAGMAASANLDRAGLEPGWWQAALLRACVLWLAGFWILCAFGWMENRNLAAIWPSLACLLLLERTGSGGSSQVSRSHAKLERPLPAKKLDSAWLLLPFGITLVILGSRGALLGLVLGTLAWYHPRLTLKRGLAAVLLLALFVTVLYFLRPAQAANRFYYWDQALQAVLEHNPWLGLGPGGISARRVLLEPGTSSLLLKNYHQHAHNLFVQVFAEFGLVGAAALAAAGWLTWKSRLQGRLQWALLAALLGHSLVDLPLYFPGPLFVLMFVAGTFLPAPAAGSPVDSPLKPGSPTLPVKAQRTKH